MDNTPLAFLTSLGGKLSGEGASGLKISGKGDAAEPGGNGFFAILNSLLTAGTGGGAGEQFMPGSFQPKMAVSDDAAGEFPIALSSEPVEGVPDVSLEAVPGAFIDGSAGEAVQEISGLIAVAPNPIDSSSVKEAAIVRSNAGSAETTERTIEMSAVRTNDPAAVKATVRANPLALAANAATVEAETEQLSIEPRTNIDREGRASNFVHAEAKQVFAAPQLPQAAKKPLPNVAQAESAILSAGVDGDTQAIDHSAVTRAKTVSVGADGAHSINPIRDQVVAAVVARQGEGRLEVRLDPPELGRVTINFESDGAELIRAVISADTPETLDLMRRNADTFQRALAERGFEGLDLEFTQSGAENANSEEGREGGHAFALGHDAEVSSLANGEEPGARARFVELGRLDRRL